MEKYYFDQIDKTKLLKRKAMVFVFNEKHKELALKDHEIIYATDFFLANLVSPQMRRNLKVDINIEPRLDVIGNVDGFGNPNRHFSINMRPIKQYKKFLTTLAHECVHIRQMAYGTLDCTLRGKHILWKKEPVNVLHGGADGYWFYPWEIEAFGLEEGLYSLFVDHMHHVQRR